MVEVTTNPCVSCVHGAMCPQRHIYESLLAHRDEVMCKMGDSGENDSELDPRETITIYISYRYMNGPALDDIYKKLGLTTDGVNCGWSHKNNCHLRRWYSCAGSVPHGSVLFRDLNPAIPSYCSRFDQAGNFSWSLVNWQPNCSKCKLRNTLADDHALAQTLGDTGFAEFDSQTITCKKGEIITADQFNSDKAAPGYVKFTLETKEFTANENYLTFVIGYYYKPDVGSNDPNKPQEPEESGVTVSWLTDRDQDRDFYFYITGTTAFGDVKKDCVDVSFMHFISGTKIVDEEKRTLVELGESLWYDAPYQGTLSRPADPWPFGPDAGDIPQPTKIGKKVWLPKDGDTAADYPVYTRDKVIVKFQVPAGKRLNLALIRAVNPNYMDNDGISFMVAPIWTVSVAKVDLEPDVEPGINCDPIDGVDNEALGVGGTVKPNWVWEYTINITILDDNFYLPIQLLDDKDETAEETAGIFYQYFKEHYIRQKMMDAWHITCGGEDHVWTGALPELPPSRILGTDDFEDPDDYWWRCGIGEIGAAEPGRLDNLSHTDMGSIFPGTNFVWAGNILPLSQSDFNGTKQAQRLVYQIDQWTMQELWDDAMVQYDHCTDENPNRIPVRCPEEQIMPIGNPELGCSAVAPAYDIVMDWDGDMAPLAELVVSIKEMLETGYSEPMKFRLYNIPEIDTSKQMATLAYEEICFPPMWDMLDDCEHAYLVDSRIPVLDEGEKPPYQGSPDHSVEIEDPDGPVEEKSVTEPEKEYKRKPLSDYLIYDSEKPLNYVLQTRKNKNMVLVIQHKRAEGIIGKPNYTIIPICVDFIPHYITATISTPEEGKELKDIGAVNQIRVENKAACDPDMEVVRGVWNLDELIIQSVYSEFYDIMDIKIVPEARVSVSYYNDDKNAELIYQEEVLVPLHKAMKMVIDVPDTSTIKRVSIADEGGTSTVFSDGSLANQGRIGSGTVVLNPGSTQGTNWELFFNVESAVSISVTVTEDNADPNRYCARCKGYVDTSVYKDWLEWVPNCTKYQSNS